MNSPREKPTFKIRNIRAFIAFRVFFNARFYYPVFTILFLDLGMSLEQFALLNVVWALSIVILEVPSGALADVVGRRNLLVFAGIAMVIEIGLLCSAPMNNTALLFAVLLINRILGGAAEAAASGADEAIAYDSLSEEGDPEEWGSVIEKEMRYKSIAFIVALSSGAAVYDPAFMNRVSNWLGFNPGLTQDITVRFPLYLTQITAVMALISALAMKEPPGIQTDRCTDFITCRGSVSKAFKLTLQAAGWIFRTPYALVIILFAMVFDHIIRMVITLNSQYFRLIDLPEALFGLIGTAFSFLGIFIPKIAKRLAENHSPPANLAVTALSAMTGLFGMSLFIPLYGLLFVLILYTAFALTHFFVSFYLNRITDSGQRATVLSIKGMMLNGAYGIIGILYSLLIALQRSKLAINSPELHGEHLENTVFMEAFKWFPWYFIFLMLLFLMFSSRKLRKASLY